MDNKRTNGSKSICSGGGIMLVKWIWESLLYDYRLFRKVTSPINVFQCLFLSILVLPFDILLSPLEIVAFIIYKFINGGGIDE